MANAWLLAPLPIAAVSASGTSVGAASNVANDFAGLTWTSGGGSADALALEDGSLLLLEDGSSILLEGSSTVEASLLIDLGSDQAVDTIMLFGVVAAADSLLTIDAATDAQGSGFGPGAYYGAPEQSLFAGEERLVNGRGVALWLAPADSRPPIRYLRLTFEPGDDGTVEVGRVVAGRRIVLDRNFVFGGTFGVRDFGTMEFSPRGVPQSRRGARLRAIAIVFANVKPDEIDQAVQPILEMNGNTEPLALITNPAPDALRERRCYFGTLEGDLYGKMRNAVAYEWRVGMTSRF